MHIVLLQFIVNYVSVFICKLLTFTHSKKKKTPKKKKSRIKEKKN
jgi:hypothetical protein